MTPSDPRVGEIQERLSAATPGPWQVDEGEIRDEDFGNVVGTIWPHGVPTRQLKLNPTDAEFIANAPADVAYLLAQLQTRDEKLARVEVLCDKADATVTPDFTGYTCSSLSTNRIRAAVAAAKGVGEQCLSLDSGRQCLLRPGHDLDGHIYPAEDS